MDVKKPKNNEKNNESKPSLKDILNQFMGDNGNDNVKQAEMKVETKVEAKANTDAKAENKVVKSKKPTTTHEEDDWAWQETIKLAISDSVDDDEFVPPIFDSMSKHPESSPAAKAKKPTDSANVDHSVKVDNSRLVAASTEKKTSSAVTYVDLDQIAEKPVSETVHEGGKQAEVNSSSPVKTKEKPDFWSRFSKLVGIDYNPDETSDEDKTTVVEEPKETIRLEPEKKVKSKIPFKVIEQDQTWEFDAAEKKDFQDEQEDESIRFSESFSYADSSFGTKYTETVNDELDEWEEKEKLSFPPIFTAIFNLLGQKLKGFNDKLMSARKEEADDSVIEEPKDLKKEAKRYARPVASITFRSRLAFVICILMVIFAATFEINGKGILGIGEDGLLMTGVLMVMLLMVMLLCVEIPLRGICSVIKSKVTAETLVTASCLITLIDGAIILMTRNASRGLPFAVVSALSVVFGMRGIRSYYIAMRNSLRVVSKVQSPWGIVTDNESIEDRAVLKKLPNTTEGFYKNLIRRDICEHAYTYAAPLMLIAAFVFAFMSTVVLERGGDFLHAFAAMVAISASFSCMSAYSMPFKLASIITRRRGCAIAGWTGADKIFSSDGVFITDADIFPKGTQSIGGMRLTSGVTHYKAIEYTGSLIIASGSELENPFKELMSNQEVKPVYVDSFACYEGGGIGGVIRGDNVLVGTAAFMNLMGVRMPDDTVRDNFIFMSVNRKLAAVFAVNYMPSNAVQSSMVAMRGTKMNMLFALKDFNVSPKMLQHKFKVPMDGVEYIPLSDCYRMEEADNLTETDTAGIISLGSLGSFAETVAKSAQLRQITLMNTLVSILGSVVGLMLVFYMCWNGPISSITSWGMALFMFAMYFVTIILSNLIKRKK